MKKINFILTILLLTTFNSLMSQDIGNTTKGEISYVTDQSVYVRFESTEGLNAGDTLFFQEANKLLPALVIKNLSSISCVCSPIGTTNLKVGDKLSGKQKKAELDIKVEPVVEETKPSVVEKIKDPDNNTEGPVKDEPNSKVKNGVSGKLSLSSYFDLTNTSMDNTYRNRYTFSIESDNDDAVFGGEAYMSFVQSSNNWDEIKNDIFNGLKIYKLSVWARPTKTLKITLGRKINRYLSNVGVIDGIQAEQKISDFTIGLYAGSRPDNVNYGYNFKLFQTGAFIAHNKMLGSGSMQTVLAFSDQENDWNTDRRFLYFQHYNSIVKNLFVMGTIQMDMYQNINDTISNKPRLTSAYINLRYRFSRKISASVGYRNQSNILYYYTYRDYINHLSDDRNVQGIRLRLTISPIKNLSVGLRGGYRNSNDDPRPTKNFNGYVSYRNLPFLRGMVIKGGFTYLETGYINGKIIDVNVSKDLYKGKVYSSLGYRNVNYTYMSSDNVSVQNIIELDLNWRVINPLMFSVSYEGSFDSDYTYNRLFLNLTWRY